MTMNEEWAELGRALRDLRRETWLSLRSAAYALRAALYAVCLGCWVVEYSVIVALWVACEAFYDWLYFKVVGSVGHMERYRWNEDNYGLRVYTDGYPYAMGGTVGNSEYPLDPGDPIPFNYGVPYSREQWEREYLCDWLGPEEGAVWIDTSGGERVRRYWDGERQEWTKTKPKDRKEST